MFWLKVEELKANSRLMKKGKNVLRKFCCLRIAISYLFLSAILISYISTIYASDDKTPEDVYNILQHIKSEVVLLRQKHEIKEEWPDIKTEGEYYPGHVYGKCLEVLRKIDRLRRIKHIGPITIPIYPLRNITPNEVYDASVRLLGELHIINKSISTKHEQIDIPETRIEYETNYKFLSAISRAIDPVIVVDGFTSNDVYPLTVAVIANARFLRESQLLSGEVEEPDINMKLNRHPNHSFEEVCNLLSKISQIQHNLWMKPSVVPKVPSGRVEANTVYDAVQIALVELQRIKYRLGLEYHAPVPETEKGEKKPNDAIYNLKLSQNLLPKFEITQPLLQNSLKALKKTPGDVYIVAKRIGDKLNLDRQAHAIVVEPAEAPLQEWRQPRHVYAKTLECMEKVNRLRQTAGFTKTYVGEYPLREITPSEVYEIALRLEKEIDIARNRVDVAQSELDSGYSEIIGKKSPSEVYQQMWQNSYLLDTLIGSKGYSSADVYIQAKKIVAEFKLLKERLHLTTNVDMCEFVAGKEPGDVINVARYIVHSLGIIERRAGMDSIVKVSKSEIGAVTPNEVYNEVGIILAEIASLKLHLNISTSIYEVEFVEEKQEEITPSHVYQKMIFAFRLIQSILE